MKSSIETYKTIFRLFDVMSSIIFAVNKGLIVPKTPIIKVNIINIIKFCL